MEKYDVKFKKKFGQNFLKDSNIVKKIVDVVSDRDDSLVLEVGPGGGILTRELASSFNYVLAYEIDNSLEEELNSRLNGFDNVDILFKDFLKTDLSTDIKDYNYSKKYFISNLPYYITSPIIMKIIESNISFDKIVLMVQKEVGERFSALPGNREYGAISVILQYFFDIKKEFNVGRNNFIPVPNVDSVIISLTPKKRDVIVNDINKFRRLVNDAFRFKRKIIKNNLANYNLEVIEKILIKNGFSLSSRAEELPVSVFIEICNSL